MHTTQGGYSGKLLSGPYQQYDGAKNLRERGQFNAGLKSGTWKAWNDARAARGGNHPWKKGNKQGAFRLYDSEGKLARAGHYKAGLLSGKVLVYGGADSVKVLRYKAGRELPSDGAVAKASFLKESGLSGEKARGTIRRSEP